MAVPLEWLGCGARGIVEKPVPVSAVAQHAIGRTKRRGTLISDTKTRLVLGNLPKTRVR